MIQRVQTVYLFLGAVALAAFATFQMPWGSSAASTYSWFIPTLLSLSALTVGLSVWAIFLYEARETQRTVVVATQVCTVALAGVLYGGLYLTSELAFMGEQGVDWGRSTMLGLPIIAYVLFFLARRGIDHDIQLVESMDRLR